MVTMAAPWGRWVTLLSLRVRAPDSGIERRCRLFFQRRAGGFHFANPTTGSQSASSAARDPESRSDPSATASRNASSPVASNSQVRASVSTTLGGLPLVWDNPEMHCTATNGGTLSSTVAPGACAASVRAVNRTASPSPDRSGGDSSPSRSQSASAHTASRVLVGSGLRRDAIPYCAWKMSQKPPSIDRHAPPYKVAGAVFLVVIAGVAALIAMQFRGTFTSRERLNVESPRAGLVVD